MKKRILEVTFLFGFTLASFGQDTLSFTQPYSYSFLKNDLNQIENTAALSSFFEKLYRLKIEKKKQINIVQIGDSHIQADFLSNSIRQLLQREFGNAGRGLIVPGRLARTNEPSTIYSSSTTQWEHKRMVYTDQPLPIGIGGITFRTNQANVKLSIRMLSPTDLNYNFNRVTLFYQKDITSFNIAVKDSAGQDLAFIGPYTFEAPNQSTVLLPFTANQITLQTLQSTPQQTQFTVYGLNLQNSQPGIIYHALGANGAKFRHYLAASLFFEQTPSLNPDLFILSLGTNEAIEYPYVDPKLLDQMDDFVKRLKNLNPDAQFILTIPADFYKKKTRRNPGVEIVRKKFIEFAEKNNMPYWDLYEIGGGKHSADLWKANALLQSDGIHFTKAGYQLQGQLLYEALIKAYNEYVLYRYP